MLFLPQASHVQQLTKTEVNASIPHLWPPPPSTSLAVAATNSNSTSSLSASTHPFQHNVRKRHSMYPVPPPPQPPHRWHHNVPNAQRRHVRIHYYPRNRWVPRRHHYHRVHVKYSPWTAWSPCSPECFQRRERYCKTKRKCGHIKHIEERKCWK